MRVAVIIAARDVAPFIGTAVSSVLTQTYSPLSLIVIDDGSFDATPSIVSALADDRLRLITQTNRGTSGTRNRGAEEAVAAEALLFLDGDDWLAPDAVARLVAALEQAPSVIASHGSFAFVEEGASPEKPGRLDRRQAPESRALLPRLVVGNLFANGGHVLIRAEAWHATGGFSTALTYGEDWEFWLRLVLQGQFTAVGGEPVLFVRRRSGSKMHHSATLPETYRPVLEAIRANAAIESRLGRRRFRRLCGRAEAEFSWTLGRELLRRGQTGQALAPLRRGLFGRPRPLRVGLWAVASLRFILGG